MVVLRRFALASLLAAASCQDLFLGGSPQTAPIAPPEAILWDEGKAECPSGYVVRGICVPKGVSPLTFYVEMHDPYYTFDPVPMQKITLLGGTATAHVLNMTSQAWMQDKVFNKSSPGKSLWYHQVTVVFPAMGKKKLGNTSFLWITGGSVHNAQFHPKSSDDSELNMVAAFAVRTNTVTAMVQQIPNEPVSFDKGIPHSPGMYPSGLRSEDAIIAYGWHKFLYEPSAGGARDAEWLLRLPMTKAVVRAMDTVTTYAASVVAGTQIDSFVVGGASKRGWTTWTTGIVDKRCKAIVPVVMDLLDLQTNSDNTYRALGGWTFEYNDYVEANIVGSVTHTPAYDALVAVSDPYSYFKEGSPWPSESFRTIPKLVVDAGNDEFFLPADDHTWWGKLPGEKHLLFIPNADHGFNFLPSGIGTQVFQAAVESFYTAIVDNTARPTFAWKTSDDGSSIVVDSLSEVPVNVTLWSATTTDGQRDWRLFNCRTGPGGYCTEPEASPMAGVAGGPRPHVVPYIPTAITRGADGTFRASIQIPQDGNYTAFFLSVHFHGGHHTTTKMSVVPRAYPHKLCEDEGKGACARLV